MVTPVIRAEKASFGYRRGGRRILVVEESSFSLFSHELVGMVGLNGSGKTTILRSLSGLQDVLEGEIFVDEVKIASVPRNELAKKVSIVLTEKVAGFNLNCFDAVAAGQIPYTNLFNQIEDAHLGVVRSAIKSCGLEAHQDKLLSELSDGLFQKTMIAKCMAQQTPLMLLDEPTAYLDYASRHELFLLLKDLSREGKCILVSSHDLDLIHKYCDKILLVKNSTAEIISRDEERWHTVFKQLSGGYM